MSRGAYDLRRNTFIAPVSPPPKQKRPLVMNVGGLSNFDSQLPFLNLVKESKSNFVQTAWSTRASNGSTDTNEEQFLSVILDSNGYANSLTCPGIPGGQVFTTLDSRVNINLGTPPGAAFPYPPGTYRFQFIGQGTILFFLDVATIGKPTGGASIAGLSVTNASANTYVSVTVTVNTPTAAGIGWRITAINSGTDYPRDMSLVQTQNTILYDMGQIFNPTFIANLQASGATVLRFMDVLQTNNMIKGGTFHYLLNLSFTANPSLNDASATLAANWPFFSGSYLITLQNGQSLTATFAAGATTCAFSPSVSSNCTNLYFHFHAVSWATRSIESQVSYTSGTSVGAPYETCLKLANAAGMDAWITVPLSFSAADQASLCSLVQSTLATGRKCYVELSNEVWNGTFEASHYATDVAPTVLGGGTSTAEFYGAEVALMADQFATTAGIANFDKTFIIVMGGQAASTSVLTTALSAPTWVGLGNTAPWKRVSASGQKTIKRVAIAPYFGNGPLPSGDFTHLTGLPDGGFTDFFASLQTNPVNGYTFTTNGVTALPAGGWFGQTSGWCSSTTTAVAPFGNLPVICYEGGWQFSHTSENPSQQTFFITASRDVRMTTLYFQYLKSCIANGVVIPAHFNFCGTYGAGQWGALEGVQQPVSTAYKFTAISNFTAGR